MITTMKTVEIVVMLLLTLSTIRINLVDGCGDLDVVCWIEDVIDDIGSLPADIKNTLTSSFTDVTDDISGVFTKVKSIATDVADLPADIAYTLTDTFTGIGKKIADLPNTISEELSSSFTDLGETIVEELKLEKVFSTLEDAMDEITDFFEDDLTNQIASLTSSISSLGSIMGKSLPSDNEINVFLGALLDKAPFPDSWINGLSDMIDIVGDAAKIIFSTGSFPSDAQRRRLYESKYGTDKSTTNWQHGLDLNGESSRRWDIDNTVWSSNFPQNINGTNFNTLFWNSEHHIIKRVCSDCWPKWQTIYYKRLTLTDSVDIYSIMYNWEKDNNVLGTDFNLYTTLTDAIADNTQNAWTYCNYGGSFISSSSEVKWRIGAFYNCGPSSSNKGSKQYAMYYDYRGTAKHASFYIYTATLAPTTSPTAETTSPTALPTTSPTPAPTPLPTSSPTLSPTTTSQYCVEEGEQICDATEAVYTSGYAYEGFVENLLQEKGTVNHDTFITDDTDIWGARQIYTDGNKYIKMYEAIKILDAFLKVIEIVTDAFDSCIQDGIECSIGIGIGVIRSIFEFTKYILEWFVDAADIHDGILLTTQVQKIFTDQNVIINNQHVMNTKINALIAGSRRLGAIGCIDEEFISNKMESMSNVMKSMSNRMEILTTIIIILCMFLTILGSVMIYKYLFANKKHIYDGMDGLLDDKRSSI
eukprot:917187_1